MSTTAMRRLVGSLVLQSAFDGMRVEQPERVLLDARALVRAVQDCDQAAALAVIESVDDTAALARLLAELVAARDPFGTLRQDVSA